MAKPRRQYTIDVEADQAVKDYAKRYTGGNESQAAAALILEGRKAYRRKTTESAAYAATGAATILAIFATLLIL